MDQFIQYIRQLSPISEPSAESIIGVCKKMSFPKKHMLIPDLAKGEFLYYIEEGLARAFYYHHAKEVTDWFGMKGMIIGPIVRKFPIKETLNQVQLLEDSTLIAISFSDLERLYQKHHDIERLGRILAINTIILIQRKLDQLQLLSASERYMAFLEDFAEIAHRIPLQYLASYLNMNKVTLSKIRRNSQIKT